MRRRYVDEALSGEGASRYPGRWNHRGVPMLYAASHASLAVLEYLANLDVATLPDDLVLLRLTLDDDVDRLERIPDGWNARPPRDLTRDIGSQWANSRRTLALLVPSVVVPIESNMLINPLHPSLSKIDVSPPNNFQVDPRLVEGSGSPYDANSARLSGSSTGSTSDGLDVR